MKLLNKALLRMSDWSRTTWCLAILMTVAFVLIGRLAQLQVFDTFDLEKKNLLQVQVDRKLQSPRGTIYDRNGKPLAMSVVTKSLYADPKMIKQSPQEIADLISPYVTMSKEYCESFARGYRLCLVESYDGCRQIKSGTTSY